MKPEEIVDTIIKTLGDANLCGIIRESARNYALGRSWGGQAEKVLKLYDMVEDEKGIHPEDATRTSPTST